ncbi:MAG: sulfatase-like hydrolase/transferase, partial [Isosphaeraceae bacterium]
DLRLTRLARQKELGIFSGPISAIEREQGPPYAFPEAIKKLGPNEVNRPLEWSSLNADQRAFQAAKMAVHAAMVDRMDAEIGRIVDQLRAMNVLENTVIMFVSDNGASAEMMVRGDGHDPSAPAGSGKTFLSIGPGWSSLANTPFRKHKTWVHEGGIATPFIVHWPAGISARGEIRHTPAHLIDIVPTLLAAAGTSAEKVAAADAPASPGKNLLPAFTTNAGISRDSLWWLHEGNRALRVGDWKIVATKAGEWELYDLASDRAETNNLAAAMPDKVREMAAFWSARLEEFKARAAKDIPAKTAPRKKARKAA